VRDKLGMPTKAAPAAAASALNVSGQISLSAALKAKVSPNDAVFVYATPANGDRMPLAIMKTTVSQLPLNFMLDDSTAMTPERKLSMAGEVLVKVRVSKSGNAMPQSGDLTGASEGPVKVGAKGLKIEIKDQIP
jgi:cytochrome c-type biogenesis protein CcmH